MCAVQDSFKHWTAGRRRIDYPIRECPVWRKATGGSGSIGGVECRYPLPNLFAATNSRSDGIFYRVTSKRSDFREPRRNDRLNRFLAPVVEVVAVLDDLHGARTYRTGLEIFGGVIRARLPVAAKVEHRALHL